MSERSRVSGRRAGIQVTGLLYLCCAQFMSGNVKIYGAVLL